MQEIRIAVKKKDAVIESGHMLETKTGGVRCDASNKTTGVVIEKVGVMVEDVV